MNILLTCAGRRNYLIEFFKDALGGCGHVFACDSSAMAPALQLADQSFVVPATDHPRYFDELATICRDFEVGMLVSVHDYELAGLAQRAPHFRAAGTVPVISSTQVIATCQDKWATHRFLTSRGIPTPATCLSLSDARAALASETMRFPLLVKPRWGMSSIGIERADNERELALAFEWGQLQVQRSVLAKLRQAAPAESLVIQEFVPGQEFGMDVVNDLTGRHVGTLARRKLVMRAGNTDRAITVDDPRLARLGQAIGAHLGHVGSLDCDVIATDHGFAVLDLNPRFGGGYPFSHLAGANVPAALIAWANGEEPDPAWFHTRPGVLSAKYDAMSIMEEPARPLCREHLVTN